MIARIHLDNPKRGDRLARPIKRAVFEGSLTSTRSWQTAPLKSTDWIGHIMRNIP